MAKPCKHPCCPDEGPCRKAKKERIKRVSSKTAPKYREYAKRAKEARLLRPYCEMRTPVCTNLTQGIHHPAGRVGDKLLDDPLWMAACNACNDWVEANHEQAVAMGLKISKHEPNYKRKK